MRRVLVLLVSAALLAFGAVLLTALPAAPARAATPHPTIASLSIHDDVPAGGNKITVRGHGFTHVTRVLFGSTRGHKVKVLSSTVLTVVAPKHAAGTVDVRVVTSSGTSPRKKTDHYAFHRAGYILKSSPSGGSPAGGTRVTLTGKGFRNVKAVLFGGVRGTALRVVSNTKLGVTAPKHAAATAKIQLLTRGGRKSLADPRATFIYYARPAVKAVTPTAGPVVAGNTVTISGSALSHASKVYFGSAAGSALKNVSSNKITVKPPKGTPSSVPITVVTPGGSSNSTTLYRYVKPPTVQSMTPAWAAASVTAGTQVTVAGMNLATTRGVTFTSATEASAKPFAAISVAANSDTQVIITVPKLPVGRPTGLYHVTLTAAGGSAGFYFFIKGGADPLPGVADAGYTWWASPSAVDDGPVTWLGSINHYGTVQISRIDRSLGTTTTADLGDVKADEHSTPAVAFDSGQSNILVFYTAHNGDTFVRYRSVNRSTLAMGTAQTIQFGNLVTYTQVMQFGSEIVLLTRSGSESWDYVISHDWGATWSSVYSLIDTTGAGQVYMLLRPLTDAGQYQFAFYGHPTNSTIHDLFYGRIDLASGTVSDAQGDVIGRLGSTAIGSSGLPGPNLDPRKTDVPNLSKAYAVPAGDDVRLLDIGLLDGKPVVGFGEWSLADPNQLASYHVVTYDSTSTNWFISPWGPPSGNPFGTDQEGHYIAGLSFGPDDTVYVAWQDLATGAWYVGSALWDGTTFSAFTVLKSSPDAALARPIVPANSATGTTKVLYQQLEFYNSYSSNYSVTFWG
ncbi:MAG TPA: IPT/TIG domain-containing protein [Jatrophihabitans sp.]